MSEPIKLNSGGVTALGDTDRVVGCDSSGALRSISFANLLAAVRDSIKVGGRNLLKGTANYKISATDMFWLSNRLTTTVEQILNSEDVVTLSVRYKKTASGAVSGNMQLGAIVANDWYEQTTFDVANLSDEGVLSRQFSIKRYRDTWTSFSLFIKGNADFEIYDVKLERGNIPTDWSPAPEDLSGGVICNHSIGYRLRKGGVPHESDNHHRIAAGLRAHSHFSGSPECSPSQSGRITPQSECRHIAKTDNEIKRICAGQHRRSGHSGDIRAEYSIQFLRDSAGRRILVRRHTGGDTKEYGHNPSADRSCRNPNSHAAEDRHRSMGRLVSIQALVARKEVAYV